MQFAVGVAGGGEGVFGDGGEGGEHVVEVVFVDVVEECEGGVEFGAEADAFVDAPFVDAVAFGALEVAGLGEGLHVVGGAGELEDTLGER